MILDSNVIIYSILPKYDSLRKFLKENESILKVSSITRIETLGFHRLTPDEKVKFEGFFQIVPDITISEAVIQEAIRLRQQRKRSTGDAIIAATALLHHLPLLTNNAGDFTDIPGLNVIPLQSVL
ncbi:type II toxin-antitoxin system VapC family toxin [Larkinella soli]|uniref:type II toxin-antitoxin system VapC family toxin n=1 Tax=Larkinella soli TaxID=1770527 RepID=UPI000FFB956F|nr:type II toxin-antitoxin system VapC family toxin [Larkinella soli]